MPFQKTVPPGMTLPFRSDDGTHMYVPATIDGATGLFGIDTGDNGAITVFDSFARKHRLFQGNGSKAFGAGVGGSVANDTFRAHDFALAGVTMSRPVVTVAHAATGAFSSRSIAGNLGSLVLSRYTLTIDAHARTITFLRNADAHAPFCGGETGLALNPLQIGSFSIASVPKSTPAWKAGLRGGDIIVAVNGRSTRSMGVLDFDTSCPSHFTPITYTVQRGKKMFVVTVHPRALP